MRAVLPSQTGEVRLGEVAEPEAGAGEVLVAVRATGLNRADLLQLRGLYPPPPGETEVPGLECAGEILELGPGVERWARGDRIMALLAGGGHGERVAVPAGQIMALPERLSFTAGAAIPEAALTAWTNLVAEGELRQGEVVLVTGASGGIGTFAVQVARELGATVIATGRDPERLARVGARYELVDGPSLPEAIRELYPEGVDLVFDLVGGELLDSHLGALRPGGRLVLIGLMAGWRAELDLGRILRRRLRLQGSVLRPRSRAEKAELVAAFDRFGAPRLADGRLHPLVDRILPFERIGEAYAALEKGGVFGKLVVEL